MKFNKIKAFTLAEVMVLMLTLSILLAAFAPVFTRRYNNASGDEVWLFVPADEGASAYYDSNNKQYTAQAFIGLTPIDETDVLRMVKDENNNILYSKLVIAASNKLKTGGKPQKQIQFRMSDCTSSIIDSCKKGQVAGALFAGNKNILLGGKYNNINDTADGMNTAYGIGALDSLTTGKRNTAIGYKTLNSLGYATDNTAIGAFAGEGLSSTGATVIGYAAGQKAGSYSTAIGYDALKSNTGSNNTAVGYSAMGSGSGNGGNNTAFGSYSLNNLTTGTYNTAVGYAALSELTTGKYNTAIGALSGHNITGSYKTVIGYNSGTTTGKTHASGLFTDDVERVFIGSYPKDVVSSNSAPGAVLEVHNLDNAASSTAGPISGIGNSSVVINGNLIVRGNTYLETPLMRQNNQYRKNAAPDINTAPKGLVLFKLNEAAGINKENEKSYMSKIKVFSGYDGYQHTASSFEKCGGHCRRRHQFKDIRPNCVCTGDFSGSNDNTTNFDYSDSRRGVVSKSYDWFSKANQDNAIDNCMDQCGSPKGCASYYDQSLNKTIYLERRPNYGGFDSFFDAMYRGTDKPYAHMYNQGSTSCCPILTSDRRLKNVGDKFTAGLDEIRKLNVYNYTFKDDASKLPQVGVIAQDLRLVFPKAVTKDDSGYYQIRWDEMFYAAINAIKTLNSKIENIASQISKDKNRVAVLKKDNEELTTKLDSLANEIVALEKAAKKRK